MINSIFYGYLSPQWKRLVRTVVIVVLFFFLILFLFNGRIEIPRIILQLLGLNFILSYMFELFVKKNPQNEVWLSILCITINIVLAYYMNWNYAFLENFENSVLF